MYTINFKIIQLTWSRLYRAAFASQQICCVGTPPSLDSYSSTQSLEGFCNCP